MNGPIPRGGVLEIPMYVPGRSRVEGRDRVIKLSSNESALGTSDKAIAAYPALDSFIGTDETLSIDAAYEKLGNALNLAPESEADTTSS